MDVLAEIIMTSDQAFCPKCGKSVVLNRFVGGAGMEVIHFREFTCSSCGHSESEATSVGSEMGDGEPSNRGRDEDERNQR